MRYGEVRKTHFNGFRQALEREDQEAFVLGDVERMCGVDADAARQLTARWVKEGKVFRLRAGAFSLPVQGGEPPLEFHLWAHMGNGFVVSHASAMAVHGLGPALPHETLYVSTELRLRPRQVRPGLALWPIRRDRGKVPPATRRVVPGLGEVLVAEPEATLLDALTEPRFSGGLLGAARFLALLRPRLDPVRLVDQSLKRPQGVRRRLGYLLEHGQAAPPAQIIRLAKALTRSYSLLDPSEPASGRYQQRWQLRLNVPHAEVLAALGQG